MRSTITVFAGIVIGFIAGVIILPSFSQPVPLNAPTEVSENNESGEMKLNQKLIFSNKIKPISNNQAWKFFTDYQGSIKEENSNGYLKTTINKDGTTDTLSIIYFFLPFDGFLDTFRARVDTIHNKKCIGLAAIPALDKASGSHTLIWTAVIEEEGENGVIADTLLFLHDPNHPTLPLVYDYTDICPDLCSKNKSKLWEENWQ